MGLGYGHAYAGFAGYPTAYAGYAAAAPVAAVAAPVAAPAVTYGTPVAHGLGLPEAPTYVAPPVRTVAEAPIVEQVPPIKPSRHFVLFVSFCLIFRSLSPSSS